MMKFSALVLALVACAANAQDTTSTGDYNIDLGQVYGAIRGAKMMGEICSESFPNHEGINTKAYKQWRARYLPFIQEIDQRFSVFAWEASGGDPQKHFQVLSALEKSMDGYRSALKAEMSADGQDAFAGQCKLYPTYLNADRMNIEVYYAEQVAVVRRGRPQKQAK